MKSYAVACPATEECFLTYFTKFPINSHLKPIALGGCFFGIELAYIQRPRRQKEVRMLRLTIRSCSPEEVVLQVDGWVSGRDVDILQQEGMRLLGEAERLVLDLKGVRFIDDAGIALLQRWSRERLVLRDGSWFVQMLLEKHGLETHRAAEP